MQNPIVAFFHCTTCSEQGRPSRLAVGFTEAGKIAVWCNTHNVLIGHHFELLNPPDVSSMICGECGKPFGQHDGSEHPNYDGNGHPDGEQSHGGKD